MQLSDLNKDSRFYDLKFLLFMFLLLLQRKRYHLQIFSNNIY